MNNNYNIIYNNNNNDNNNNSKDNMTSKYNMILLPITHCGKWSPISLSCGAGNKSLFVCCTQRSPTSLGQLNHAWPWNLTLWNDDVLQAKP